MAKILSSDTLSFVVVKTIINLLIFSLAGIVVSEIAQLRLPALLCCEIGDLLADENFRSSSISFCSHVDIACVNCNALPLIKGTHYCLNQSLFCLLHLATFVAGFQTKLEFNQFIF